MGAVDKVSSHTAAQSLKELTRRMLPRFIRVMRGKMRRTLDRALRDMASDKLDCNSILNVNVRQLFSMQVLLNGGPKERIVDGLATRVQRVTHSWSQETDSSGRVISVAFDLDVHLAVHFREGGASFRLLARHRSPPLMDFDVLPVSVQVIDRCMCPTVNREPPIGIRLTSDGLFRQVSGLVHFTWCTVDGRLSAYFVRKPLVRFNGDVNVLRSIALPPGILCNCEYSHPL